MTHLSEISSPLLQLRGITKRYGSFIANQGIDLTLQPGEIHAILGENGAGKSTLMKTIFGVHKPDEGCILWKGQEVQMDSPGQARSMGIGMVFQHFSLFETVSVVENISLTVLEPLSLLAERIRAKSEEFGLPVDPMALVHGLSVGERQRVEIIRCLLQEPDLLILDEPTSVLPPPNVKQLFGTLRQLSEKGIAILYISHKLDEIRALCHSATILRHGQVTGTADPASSTSKHLAKLMIGRDIPHATHAEADGEGEVRLAVHDLSYSDPDPHAISLKNIELEVRSGEIMGVAGVSGNGQSALSRLLSGEDVLPAGQAGRIQLLGNPAGHLNPEHRRKIGLSFVPEERLGRGAAPPMSLSDNGLLTAHRRGLVKHGLIRRTERDRFTERCIEEMDVRAQGKHALASSLSGGNLQKYIVGREMQLEPKVLVVSQPTWGIDVGAAAMVRQKLVDLRETGAAILVISEELEELFEISDRMVVMYDGRMSPSVRTRNTNAEQIGQMMIGQFGTVQEAAE
ncbi:ABC transporter ATP-binding protein [Leisingera sp.]|uniref:ABC transporter ATP-binding protein n=1 Tax=Leisingera sp. TaxID=1879318 RepID=UPI002B279ADF|nr:ABC transporter ATP-binding protein [Leisingera sp.]